MYTLVGICTAHQAAPPADLSLLLPLTPLRASLEIYLYKNNGTNTFGSVPSKLASFLGDSRFPEVAMKSTRGGKIRLFQDLYSRYSRLELSHDEDRPVAIAGIEKHLISSFGIRGGFGVLDDGNCGLLWRSLLWQRGRDARRMVRINFDSVKVGGLAAAIIPPPSWSWMAYRGAIDYLNLPFDKMEWEKDDICSQWSRSAGKTWNYSRDYSTCPLELTVVARVFDFQAAQASAGAGVVLDDPERTDVSELSLRCIVLGRLKRQTHESMDIRTHYVLLVTPTTLQDGGDIYNRVGIGYMPGALINLSEKETPGQLQ